MAKEEKNTQPQEETVDNPTQDVGTKIVELLNRILAQKELTTYIINLSNIKIPNSYPILKLKGSGIVTEVAVLSTSTFNIYIKVDNKEILNKNADYTTLAQIGGVLNDVDADNSGGNNRVVIRNINFRKNILIQVTSDTEITAQNIFCKYDLEEQPEKLKKECSI